MKSKSVALAVVPLFLAGVVAGTAQQMRLEEANAATESLLNLSRRADGSPEFAASLLARGADVTARDEIGFTALHRAASFNAPVAKVLVRAGAAVDAYADDGSTPLANAVQTNNVEAVRLLLHEGANVDLPLRHRNGETTTPLSNSRACDG